MAGPWVRYGQVEIVKICTVYKYNYKYTVQLVGSLFFDNIDTCLSDSDISRCHLYVKLFFFGCNVPFHRVIFFVSFVCNLVKVVHIFNIVNFDTITRLQLAFGFNLGPTCSNKKKEEALETLQPRRKH